MQIVRQSALGGPEVKGVEVAAISEDGVGRHTAFGLKVVAKGSDVSCESRAGASWLRTRMFHCRMNEMRVEPASLTSSGSAFIDFRLFLFASRSWIAPKC